MDKQCSQLHGSSRRPPLHTHIKVPPPTHTLTHTYTHTRTHTHAHTHINIPCLPPPPLSPNQSNHYLKNTKNKNEGERCGREREKWDRGGGGGGDRRKRKRRGEDFQVILWQGGTWIVKQPDRRERGEKITNIQPKHEMVYAVIVRPLPQQSMHTPAIYAHTWVLPR